MGSYFDILRFDNVGAGWEPIANPSILQQDPSWVSIKTLVVANSARIIEVSLSESGMANFPEYSFSASPKIASSTGTSVYRDVMLKNITTSSWSRKIFLKLSALCFDEQFIFDSTITDYHAVIFSASL